MRWEYLREISNYADMFGTVMILAYCSLKLQDPSGIKDQKYREKLLERMISCGSFICNIRLFFHLTVFSRELRQIVTVITQSIFQLKYFIFMLYFFVLIISISNYALQVQTPELYKSFGHVLTDQYNILYIGTVDEFYDMRWET